MNEKDHARATASEKQDADHHRQMERRQYLRFAAMIATSTVVMFVLTYTNSYAWDHVRWSEERVYMALLMGGAMGVVMLGFMWGMHKNRTINVGIMAGSVVLMAVALFLSRSQRFVDDREYMKGMIPHHSIAILTSEHADIDDLRVCELANEIIRSQRQEIAEMSWLIDDIAENGEATTRGAADERAAPAFESDDVREDC
jgi:cadmium resistance protein CadD (predicted permease)